jgi:hypothetical protein
VTAEGDKQVDESLSAITDVLHRTKS